MRPCRGDRSPWKAEGKACVIPSLHVIRIGANVKRWNFAIVGAGNIGKVHAQAINSLDNARVSVVCDVNQESARALVKSSDATFTHDYRRVIENPNVDVVCVCTPSGSHAGPSAPLRK